MYFMKELATVNKSRLVNLLVSGIYVYLITVS